MEKLMLCSYGCGKTAVKQFKNGKYCCSGRSDQCSAIIEKRIASRRNNGQPWVTDATRKKIGLAGKGKIISQETRQKQSDALIGIPKGPMPEETKKKISETKKQNPRTGWNKGLTAFNDSRVAAIAQKQKGQKRTGNYVSSNKWKGEGNYWYGKSRSKELSPRYNGEKFNNAFRDYRNKVSWLTEQAYRKHKEILNPMDKERTLAGVENGYQLDHIYPIMAGFKNNIPAELIADIKNLQLLTWEENLNKSNNILTITEEIQQYLTENK